MNPSDAFSVKGVIEMTIGENLMSLRNEANLSRADLALKLGVEEKVITEWEENISTPDAKGLIALSAYYKLPIDTIVYGNQDAPEYDESKAVFAKPKFKNDKDTGLTAEQKQRLNSNAVGKVQRNNKMSTSEKFTMMVFPIFCVIVFVLIGLCLKVWHPTWLILSLIPVYFGLFFMLRYIGNKVDSAVEEYVNEEE